MSSSDQTTPDDSENESAIVHILPAGVELPVSKGQSLLGAALFRGYRWRTICGGQEQCGVCVVEVVEGDLPQPQPREKDMLSRSLLKARHGGEMRLACQIFPEGPLTVFNPIIREQM